MNRNHKIIKQIPKYIIIIEYISAITGLSLLFNPCYEDSDNVVYDPAWKHYNYIKLKKPDGKAIPLFSSYIPNVTLQLKTYRRCIWLWYENMAVKNISNFDVYRKRINVMVLLNNKLKDKQQSIAEVFLNYNGVRYLFL